MSYGIGAQDPVSCLQNSCLVQQPLYSLPASCIAQLSARGWVPCLQDPWSVLPVASVLPAAMPAHISRTESADVSFDSSKFNCVTNAMLLRGRSASCWCMQPQVATLHKLYHP